MQMAKMMASLASMTQEWQWESDSLVVMNDLVVGMAISLSS